MSEIKEPKWRHPGGKLRELGAESLTDAELLAILIGTGTKNKSAEDIAKEVLEKFGGFRGIANQPLEKFLKVKGIGDAKITRIVAAFEMGRRIFEKEEEIIIEKAPDLSFKEVSEEERTKHVHRLHPYLGKFIPQLVEYFLTRYFKEGETILDPFVGSGTTLVEASVLGINSIGIEISEFNCLISKVKTDVYDIPLLEKEIKDILYRTVQFSKRFCRIHSLFPLEEDQFKTKSKYLNEWFAPRSLQEILYYRSLIPDYQYQGVLKVILSRSARSARQIPHYDLARPKEPVKEPYWCYKHSRICKPIEEALKFIRRYSYDTIRRIKEYSKIKKKVNIQIMCGDARNICLENKTDGVFTSPPYVGLIDYHDQHRYAYELFNFNNKADQEIGAAWIGQNEEAQHKYKEDIIKAFNNIKQYVEDRGLVFVVANDKFSLYPEIAEKSGFKILHIFNRPVNKRTERSKNEYKESIFTMRKE